MSPSPRSLGSPLSKDKRAPYFGLTNRRQRKTVRDFIDFTYLSQLTELERRWLDSFCREYYQADMRHGIHDKDNHDCYTMNNARNRDGWHMWERAPGHAGDYLLDLENGEEEDAE